MMIATIGLDGWRRHATDSPPMNVLTCRRLDAAHMLAGRYTREHKRVDNLPAAHEHFIEVHP